MSLFSELKRRNVIRVTAAYLVIGWLLLQVADTITPALHLPEWILSAITLVLILGFIPTVLFSWAYELTPDGIKKDSEAKHDAVQQQHTAKKLDVITLIAVIGIVALIAWQNFKPQQADSASNELASQTDAPIIESVAATEVLAEQNSIAVLPFVDLSPAGDQAYFSDGIAEEILNVLVKVKQLKVASRTSSFGFKGQESMGIPAIAEKLNVRHVLEGSVRKSGEMVRVTAQLIDADTDQHLWSETYDRELNTENLFAIQDEVAKAIVEQLGIALNADQQPSHDNQHLPTVDNYDLFLKARALYRARTQMDKADGYLIQLLEQDPEYAPAWEIRAALASLMNNYGYSHASDDEVIAQVDEFASKALAINPNSALAFAAKANVRRYTGWGSQTHQNQQQIITDLQKATELDPNLPSPMNWLAMTYAGRGFLDLSVETFIKCQQRHPFFAPCVENLFDVLVSDGQLDQAWVVFTQAIEQGVSTGNWVNYYLLAKNNQRTAFLLVTGGRDLFLGFRNVEGIYHAFQNLDADHSVLLKNVLAFAEKQESFNWIDSSRLLIPLGAHQLIPIETSLWGVDHRKYRQSPEFKSHMKATGIFDYWQQHGYPPQCRALGEDDFECD